MLTMSREADANAQPAAEKRTHRIAAILRNFGMDIAPIFHRSENNFERTHRIGGLPGLLRLHHDTRGNISKVGTVIGSALLLGGIYATYWAVVDFTRLSTISCPSCMSSYAQSDLMGQAWGAVVDAVLAFFVAGSVLYFSLRDKTFSVGVGGGTRRAGYDTYDRTDMAIYQRRMGEWTTAVQRYGPKGAGHMPKRPDRRH